MIISSISQSDFHQAQNSKLASSNKWEWVALHLNLLIRTRSAASDKGHGEVILKFQVNMQKDLWEHDDGEYDYYSGEYSGLLKGNERESEEVDMLAR